jgi:predicted porin
MNKQFAGIFLAGAAGMVFAQSSVEVYGVVDLAVSSYRGAGAGSKTMITSSGNTASRIGFRGKETLGGEMEVGFDLEAGLNVDAGAGLPTNANNQPHGSTGNGGMTFNRKSYLYLGGKAGQIRLGRDYTPSFWNTFVYDPYRVGVGISGLSMHGTTSTGIRASNSIGYYTPGCSSFQCKGPFLQLMYAMGENSGPGTGRNDGNYWGFRVGYGAANWDVAIASGTTRNAVANNYVQRNIGAGYLWNGHRLMLLAGENKAGRPVAAMDGGHRVRFAQVGGWIKVRPSSPDYLPVSYTYLTRNDAQDSKAHKLSVGYVHLLSRRTAVYGAYAFVRNGGLLRLPVSSSAEAGPTPRAGGHASGLDIGIRHSF